MGEFEGRLPVAIAKRASSQVDALLLICASGSQGGVEVHYCARCCEGKYAQIYHGSCVTTGEGAIASGAAKRGEALNAAVAGEGDFGGSPPYDQNLQHPNHLRLVSSADTKRTVGTFKVCAG